MKVTSITDKSVVYIMALLVLTKLNWILVLGNMFFSYLERYSFKKYDISDIFQLICGVIHDVIEIIV